MNGIPYWRLPGSSGFLFRKSLWLGPDHLLSVSSNVSSQEYRRLYYSEIQALIVTEVESSARFYGLVFAGIAGAFAVALGVKDHDRQYFLDMQLFWAVTCAIACVGLVVFALTRPKVRCSLKTRAGTQYLPSLKSMERARRVAAILRTEIDKAQGTLTGEVLMYSPIEAARIPPGFRAYNGWMHHAAFAVMLLSSLLALLRPPGATARVYADVVAGLNMSVFVLACAAAVNQRGSGISQTARMSIALSLTWIACSYVATVVVVAAFAASLGAPQAPFQSRFALEYGRYPVREIANANAIAYGILGLVGLIAMFAGKRRVRAA
jgi:hypothetical protein